MWSASLVCSALAFPPILVRHHKHTRPPSPPFSRPVCVQVRGYSIALGAVEHAVLDRLAVKSTVVIAEGAEGEDKRLVGYLVRADEADVAGRHVWDDIDPGKTRDFYGGG